jgi:GH15 family glucan-1,4-alpha-glucosidase
MTDLRQRSIEIILENQSATGAYPASPNFDTYRYSWFRDGAFIAYAMDLSGHHESAYRFHHWAAATVNQRAAVVERAVAKAVRGEALAGEDILDTRYSMDGQAGEEDWPNFQLDGFGTWLWSLEQHQRLAKMPLPSRWLEAADLVADYLAVLWQRPCYDCWEEFPDRVHVYTLGAVHSGLFSHALLRGRDSAPALAVKRFAKEKGTHNGHLVKYLGSDQVDACLVALAAPYNVLAPNDPVMQATVSRIETDLYREGGVHRYSSDTYYGGGAWVLLTAWLGWYYLRAGDSAKAQKALRWIELQADADGNMPEQVPTSLNDPSYYEPWRRRWGEIACPLLWSHATHIILSLGLAV